MEEIVSRSRTNIQTPSDAIFTSLRERERERERESEQNKN